MSETETWYGWLRRTHRCKWQRVCGPCGSLAEASRQLGAEAKRRGIADKNTCLTTGHEPRDAAAALFAGEPPEGPARPSNYLGGR